MHVLGTIRRFKTKNFTVVVEALEEDDQDFSFDESGEVAEKVHSGEWLCFCARVRVLTHGHEIGVDYLGNCIYPSLGDFMDHRECGKQNRIYEQQGSEARCGSYFRDMVSGAIAEARKTLKYHQSIRVRLGH